MSVHELMDLIPIGKEWLVWLKKKRAQHAVREWPWTGDMLHKGLLRNGHIIGRAHSEHRSLTGEERKIIDAVRIMARQTLQQISINATEMEGERDKEIIYQPIKVKAKFAYYNSGEYGWDPQPSYHITESNHPALPVHGNVGREELENNSVKIPRTPTYDKWVAGGRKVFRG